jgi:plastocyanin
MDMGLGCKALLVVAALACAAAPALADGGADARFVAVDFAWRANDTDAATLTIVPGQTVAFSYPSGNSTHDVNFTGRRPDCTGLPPAPYPPRLWTSATCRFDEPGTYAFVCDAHADMTGTVVVAEPTPSPTATADPGTPSATPAPVPSATPGPAPPQTTLALKLARHQKGTRVRGSVHVGQAGSRLVVTVRSGKAQAGTWVKQSAAAGRVSFAVALNARTRTALRAERRLRLTVTVALTPPAAKTLTTTAKATVSL